MTNEMKEYYKKKIELLTEQCSAYEQLVSIQKSDIEALEKQLSLSEKVIKGQEDIIEINKAIEEAEEKKRQLICNFSEELRKN